MASGAAPLTGLDDPMQAGTSTPSNAVDEGRHSKKMIKKSPSINNSSSANVYQQSAAQQQRQIAADPSTLTTALDPAHQAHQTGRPTSSLAQHLQPPTQQQQQSSSPQQATQYTQQQHPNHRWPEVGPGSSAIAGPQPSGMMLVPPQYQYQQQPQPVPQQYAIAHPQQQHLAVPGQTAAYGGNGYPGFAQPQQHSPSAGTGTQRTYGPQPTGAGPLPAPQMLHPAMMYAPLPHGYPSPYMTQYWASTAAAAAAARNGTLMNGPPVVIGGQHPGVMGPPLPPQPTHYQPPLQSSLIAPHDAPSTSRQTPNQQVAPSPSAGSAAVADESSMEESSGALRPKSSQSQIHPSTQPPPPPQQIPSQMRYPPGVMMIPPNAAAASHPQQQFQPPPMGHPGINGPPQMQIQHHMGPPTTSQMHSQAMAYQGHPHQGIYFQPPFAPPNPAATATAMAGAHHPQQQQQQQQPQQPPQPQSILPGLKPAQREAVDKLVAQLANPKQQQLTPELLYERRLFYERLVMLNEQQGEILAAPPQVSKTTVDLHSLYFAVRKKGGFKKTIQDKIWKNLCTDANVVMQQSSAAGFQLRKHYQKFLLKLECVETGQDEKELVEFAEKQKKKKKEKEPIAEPPTPSSSSSTANKDEQQAQQQQNMNRTSNEIGQQPTLNGPMAPQQQQSGSAAALTPCSTLQASQPAVVPSSSVGATAPGLAEFSPSNVATYSHPPPQWYQQQQMLHRPSQMRPPQSQQQQQLTEEEQLQQKLHNQRLPSTSSRLSAASTPAPAGEQQKPPSRAPSVAVVGCAVEKLESSDEQQHREGGQPAQQHQRQTQTPLSAFSANAPTPPLTISTPGAINSNSQLSAGVPSSIQSPHHQQQNMPPSYYHHPSGAYIRYPIPPGAPTNGEPQQFYGPSVPGMVYPQQQQQQQMWSYGIHPTAAAATTAARYQLSPTAPPTGRYAPYTVQAQPTSTPVITSTTPSGAQNSPVSTSTSQSQLSTALQQQQQQPPPPPQQASTSKSKHHGTPTTSRNSSNGSGSNNNNAAVVSTTSAVAAPPTAVPSFSSFIPIPQYPAWFGASTACTHPSPFPAHSLEAQTIAQVQQLQQQAQQQRYRRTKIYSRDLYGATPARIVMALRSGLHAETCWALNALNIQLTDDTSLNTAPSLAQTPELLNLLVDHFTAVLSLLYAKHLEANYCMNWSNFASFSCTDSKILNNNKRSTKSHHNSDSIPKSKCIDARNAAINSREENANDNITKSNVVQQMVRAPPLQQQSPVNSYASGNGNAHHTTTNFTMVSRLGRVVKLDTGVKMPATLAKALQKQQNDSKNEEFDIDYVDETADNAFFPEFVQRIRNSILVHIRAKHASQKLVQFKQSEKEESTELNSSNFCWWSNDDVEEKSGAYLDSGNEHSEEEEHKEENIDNTPNLFYRKSHSWEHWDQHSVDECTLLPRPTVLQHKHADELVCELVDRCLALSNILRSFSFLPGQERPLAEHKGLLRLLPALLMLMVDAPSQRKCAGAEAENDGRRFSMARSIPFPTKTNEHTAPENEDGEQKAALLLKNRKNHNVPADQDTYRQWLMDVANQLRDDAFTILAHISPFLDLFDADSTISWPIFDSLLHWSVSMELTTRDPLPPYGAIPPRHYAFEILCKMSVLERNVDLLVATGPWPRLEAFVRLLCRLVCDEPAPVREFAIVILNAVCAACEPVCYIVAVETQLLEHLVQFLEAADANMTQIAQHQGIHTLRENPEIIGTSVGMLRRAAHIMVQLAKNERCRKQFLGFQHRLLQFTVSHFMDSRVAAMVADILFEIQRANHDSKHMQFSTTSHAHDGSTMIAQESTADECANEQQEQKQSDTATSTVNQMTTTTGTENNHLSQTIPHASGGDGDFVNTAAAMGQHRFNSNNGAAVVKHHFSGEIPAVDDAIVDHTEQFVFNGGDCITASNGILLLNDNDSCSRTYCDDGIDDRNCTFINNNNASNNCGGIGAYGPRCSSALSTTSSSNLAPFENNNSFQGGNLASANVAKKKNNKQQKCRGGGTDTPNRKRPRNGKCQNTGAKQHLPLLENNHCVQQMETEQDYANCNGASPSHTSDEIKNNNNCAGTNGSPPEKRAKKNSGDGSNIPIALSTTPTQQQQQQQIPTTTMAENVRERMRNNILGKTAISNGNTMTNNKLKGKNGWIVDPSSSMSTPPSIPTDTFSSSPPLQNGITMSATTATTAAVVVISSGGTAAGAGGSSSTSSLTAVA